MSFSQWLQESPHTMSMVLVGMAGVHLGDQQRMEYHSQIVLATTYLSFFVPFVMKTIEEYVPRASSPSNTPANQSSLEGIVETGLARAFQSGFYGLAVYAAMYNIAKLTRAALDCSN